jgi:restriction system protein
VCAGGAAVSDADPLKEFGENIPTIWQMIVKSTSEAQTAAMAAQQAASQSSRFISPSTGALNTSPLNAVTLNATYAEPAIDLMLQTVVTLGAHVTEGQVIEAVSIAWFKIVDELLRDPSLMKEISWRRWEEMIAGAYDAEGWDEVILTPRSGDGGRDVIATRRDFGSIRIIEQVKAYEPGKLVTANDVRALLGVLHADPNASKGIVTTTSGFAPGIYDDQAIIQYMPNRLDLRPGDKLMEWLAQIRAKKRGS